MCLCVHAILWDIKDTDSMSLTEGTGKRLSLIQLFILAFSCTLFLPLIAEKKECCFLYMKVPKALI